MRKDIRILQFAIQHKEHFEIHFQFETTFQRVSMYTSDPKIRKMLNDEELCFGGLGFELFERRGGEFTIDDHIQFLSQIRYHVLHDGYYSSDGRFTDTGMGLLIILSDESLLLKLNKAITEKIAYLKNVALDRFGNFQDISKDDFRGYREKKLEHLKNNIIRVEKELPDYNPESDKYKALSKTLEEEKELLELLS